MLQVTADLTSRRELRPIRVSVLTQAHPRGQRQCALQQTMMPAYSVKVLRFSQCPKALSYFHFFLEKSLYKTAVWPQSSSTDHCRCYLMGL